MYYLEVEGVRSVRKGAKMAPPGLDRVSGVILQMRMQTQCYCITSQANVNIINLQNQSTKPATKLLQVLNIKYKMRIME